MHSLGQHSDQGSTMQYTSAWSQFEWNLKPRPAHISTYSTKSEPLLGTDCCQLEPQYQDRKQEKTFVFWLNAKPISGCVQTHSGERRRKFQAECLTLINVQWWLDGSEWCSCSPHISRSACMGGRVPLHANMLSFLAAFVWGTLCDRMVESVNVCRWQRLVSRHVHVNNARWEFAWHSIWLHVNTGRLSCRALQIKTRDSL